MPDVNRLVFKTALCLSLAPLVLAPASASTATVLPAPAPAPAPAPSGGVAGPPDGLIAPPPPRSTRPFPNPQIFPQPVQPSGPIVQPLPPRRPAPTPAPRPSTQVPAPAPTTATPAPTTQPEIINAPPAGEPLPPPVKAEPGAPPPLADGPPPLSAAAPEQIPEWLPLAAIGGLFALLGIGWLFWRRRRTRLALPAPEAEEATPPPAPGPVAKPVAARPVATPQPAAATALGRRADLDIVFEPLSAQSTLLNLRLRYAVTVRNTGQIAAEPVTVRIGLFAGSQVHPQGIAQWFGLADQPLHHAVDRVEAGTDYRFEGELAAPLDALNPMTIDGRVLAIPLVAVDARYNHGTGEAPIDGQSARAFVIGREPQREGAKLAPFRLDQGPTSFAPLGQRDTGISKVA